MHNLYHSTGVFVRSSKYLSSRFGFCYYSSLGTLNMMYREFLDNGIAVFPLYPIDENGKCGCGNPSCKAIGKHPRAGNWQSSPIWGDDQLTFMEETNQFSSGYGVLCKNLIVIDVDSRNGGVDSYTQLVDAIPEISGAGLIVSTGSGNGSKHIYFKAPQGIALQRHLSQYPGIDAQSGASYVVGPGSTHASGSTYTILHGSPADIDDAPAALVDLLRMPERHRVEYNGGTIDVSYDEVADMVAAIPNNDEDYETFIRIGMAIHHSLDGNGFDIWDKWASTSGKYEPDDMDYKWHSFGKSSLPVTIGTLIHYAESNGWQRPVVFAPTADTDPTNTPLSTTPNLNVDDIDLQRPPGFAGRLKEYLDSQCRYPREWLTLGASLVTLGNVMGLRYTDEDDTTANLFVFCVAGSSSGKEAVLQLSTELMILTGLSPAVHGVIKSEQEVYRNLIRHQPAYYLMDEIGIHLRRIKNAQKKGGATHLEGVFGILMSAYSKANGYLLVGGDVKEDVKEKLRKELSQLMRLHDNNELPNAEEQIKVAQEAIAAVDNGLKHPFISILGFTTPEMFDDMIDVEQATSGFIGRCMLITEKDTNPRLNKTYKRKEVPQDIVNTLLMLRHGGHFDQFQERIHHPGPRTIITTTPEAREFMALALEWMLDYADEQRSSTGLEAVARRGYELMAKISLILACEGVRTLEHVRYAFKLVKRDIDQKLKLVVSNDKTARSDTKLYATIAKHIDKDHGETFGVLRNKMRSYKEDDIQQALTNLERAGEARSEVVTNKYNKKQTIRWFLTK